MGFLALKTGPSLVLKTGPIFFCCFFPSFIVFFGAFLETQIVQQCVKIVFFCKIWGMSKMRFSKRKLHFLFFPFLCWRPRNRKKKKKNRKWKRPKNPVKNRFFLRWSCKSVKNQKTWIFCKNWLTLFVSGREKKNAHFRAHYLFWPKFFFGPKQCKPGKTTKIVVSAEIAQKQK